MKQRTRILIYILIAITVVILGTMAIITNHNANKPVSVQEKIDLGHAYLLDLSYEKAALEFAEAIEIDPMNADAYLGLAEAYQGMGAIDKAIEALETGYEKTGDQRLKDKLDELSPPEETTVTTTVPTTVTTTGTTTTIELVTVPDLAGMTKEEALSVCEELGISCEIKTEESDTVEKDLVISQSVSAGVNVPVNYAISVMVSNGKNDIIITESSTNFTQTTVEEKQSVTSINEISTYDGNENEYYECQYQPYKDLFSGQLIGKQETQYYDSKTNEFDLTELHQFTPKKTGYYSFKYTIEGNCGHSDCGEQGHRHEAGIHYFKLDNGQPGGTIYSLANENGVYLEENVTYCFYISVYWDIHFYTTQFDESKINLKYDVDIYEPEDFDIAGNFKGKVFFKGQEQVFYFTPKMSGKYNIEFNCNKDTDKRGLDIAMRVGLPNEAKNKVPTTNQYGSKSKINKKIDLEENITYAIIITEKSSYGSIAKTGEFFVSINLIN